MVRLVLRAVAIGAVLLTLGGAKAWAGPDDCPKWMRSFLVIHPSLDNAFKAFDRGDCHLALKRFQAKAERGNVAAQHNVGVVFDAGLGVDGSDQVAEKWYRMAAEQGLLDAQYNLAVILAVPPPKTYGDAARMYLEFERGTKPKFPETGSRYVEAYMWLILAEENGHAAAPLSLKRLGGRMTPADISKAQRLAREWLEKRRGRK